jgi:hypothetical protein
LIYNGALLAFRVLSTRHGRKMIGAALNAGQDDAGTALWELTIRGVKLPGRWTVIDRQFRRWARKQASPRRTGSRPEAFRVRDGRRRFRTGAAELL